MATITISDSGCRGCTMCVDICPVDVFDFDEELELARVRAAQDCIGCLSCSYLCPSGCIEVSDITHLRPFHRIQEHAALVERFLQAKQATTALTDDDIAEAERDVAARLNALAHAVVETMGRGHKAVGRRSGVLAAEHLPEVFEEDGVAGVLESLKRQFRWAFELDYTIADDAIKLDFHPCGLCRVVSDAGEVVGEAVLCELFHEYLAGLLTTYLGQTYRSRVISAGDACELSLEAVRR